MILFQIDSFGGILKTLFFAKKPGHDFKNGQNFCKILGGDLNLDGEI